MITRQCLQLFIEVLCRLVEDVAEDTVVDKILIVIIRFDQVANVVIEETQLATQIRADSCWTDTTFLCREAILHDFHHLIGFEDSQRTSGSCQLSCLKCLVMDRFLPFHHLLEHETRHLTCLSIVGGVIIYQCHIFCPLQQAMEIMFVDSHLMIYRCQTVSFSDAIGNKRGIAHPPRHVPFIAGEHQHMIEIEVSRLKHTHDLNTFCWFAVKGYRGGLYYLGHQSLKGDDVHLQRTTIYQVCQTI